MIYTDFCLACTISDEKLVKKIFYHCFPTGNVSFFPLATLRIFSLLFRYLMIIQEWVMWLGKEAQCTRQR